ncbi:DUF1308 domain containing protein [Trichuris trichiura]|uniref:DUF1308 domain containing protein n=1 Tax=Trichuris trichiura TaxID=36087 RepID=A0A077ZK48_TRITR|nr:DUF1308 domain containing protein [Trichuris trichiura]
MQAKSFNDRNLHQAVFCSNLKQLVEVVLTCVSVPSVTGLLKVFLDRDGVPLIVDVVANNGATWIKVISGRQNLLAQAEQFLETADSNVHRFKRPVIVFRFCHGAAEPLARRLLKLGVQVQASLVDLPVRYTYDKEEEEYVDDNEGLENQEVSLWNWESYVEFESSIEKEKSLTINLDLSTMMTYVSDMCFGGSNYVYDEPLINMQAEWERKNSVLFVLPHHKRCVSAPRKLICCQTAVDSFMKILKDVGGPEEQLRAKNLLSRIEVVEDCVSERAKKLTLSSKIKPRTIVMRYSFLPAQINSTKTQVRILITSR